MSYRDNWRPASSYVSKLDLTLCRQKSDRSHSASRDQCFGTRSEFADTISSVPSSVLKNLADGSCTKPGDFSGAHSSRLDITLEQEDRRKSAVKETPCVCSFSASRLHMPWRYSSSCRDSQGSQACLGQGGFAPDHGCGFTETLHKNQHLANAQSTSCSSSGDDHIQLAESFPSPASKKQSSWTSRLDVVLASNATVSTSQTGNPPTVFASCNPERPSKDDSECVTQMANLKGMKMYISSCSLTVQPFQSKYQGGNHTQSVLLMPQREKPSREYPMSFQTPQEGFTVTEAPTLQITQFQVTRSPANPSPPQQTSTREIWMSSGRHCRVAGSSGSPDMVPNVIVFHRGHSPIGCRTDLYPVLIPTQHKASKITLIIGSPVAPVPVQVIQEYSRSPTPAIFISNGDHPTSPEDLGSGFLLSVNTINCSKQRHMDNQRSNPVLVPHPAKCKPTEPHLCHTPSCTVMPRLPDDRDGSAPIVVSIEAFGSRRGAVKISISH